MNSDLVSFPTPKASSSNESQTLLNSLLLQIQQNCPSSEEKPKAANSSTTKTVPKRKSPTTETKKNKYSRTTTKKVTAPERKCKRKILSDTDDKILNDNLLNENNFLQ
jgi:hypothetical protein